jgi:hypothetical protein
MTASSPVEDHSIVPSNLCHEQVRKVVGSEIFRTAPTLQLLLRFLAAKVLDEHAHEIKEYTIGVEALGRRQDFDPKTDPIVRVQVYRLRQKLKEYYDLEGSQDSILVDIPRGHYLPRFESMSGLLAGLHPVGEPKRERDSVTGHAAMVRLRRMPHGVTLAVAAVLAVLMFASGFWVANHQHGTEFAAASLRLAPTVSGDPVKSFWAPLLSEDSSPIIAYADAIFLLDDSTDLFRFRRGAADNRGAPVDAHLARQFAANPALVTQAGSLYYDNGYTGIGELQAVATLTALFTQMGASPTVESSYNITTDDLKQHDVILLGSPFQNVAVQQLPPSGDFLFVDPASLHDLWDGRIIDTHPRPGERAAYQTERDPVTRVLTADYALITFEPGVVAGRHIVDLGGLDTTGTEGAVLLATSKVGVQELTQALGPHEAAGPNGKVPTFQALIRVNLEKGYQVLNSQLLTVHPIDTEHSAEINRTLSH